jgi:hypothetical protein
LRTFQEIVTPQTEKRFSNEGLPYPKDPTKRGDLIVKFDILFPKLLNNEQRTLTDCCLSNSTDFYQPHNSVLHTTTIDQIQQQQQQQQTSASELLQQQQLASTPPSTSPIKPQASSNHHQKTPQRHINNNGRQKSPANKTIPIRIPPPVPPRPSPTSLTGTHAKETVF